MVYLITGTAGFIGFSISNFLLRNKKNKVIGIDNLNNYYSVKLKQERINFLKKNKNFFFYKADIKEKKQIEKIIKNKNIDIVIHLAAQAGVRYSIINPRSFIENNILGFFNIIELCSQKKIKKFFYASSSSVYGETKNFPVKENQKINPKNIYGLSKKHNEEIVEVLKNSSNIKNFIGLRFFTVFGQWGRPDMFIMKYLNSVYKNNIFYLNNYGNHIRDFTYIDDACVLINKLINKKIKRKHEVFNVCSNKPIFLSNIIDIINKITGILPNIKKRGMQIADIYKTHGDNTKIKKKTKFRLFTNIDEALIKTIKWYREYNNLNSGK